MSECKTKLTEEQLQALKQLQLKIELIQTEIDDLYNKTLATAKIDDHDRVFDFVFNCSSNPKDRYTKLVTSILRDGY